MDYEMLWLWDLDWIKSPPLSHHPFFSQSINFMSIDEFCNYFRINFLQSHDSLHSPFLFNISNHYLVSRLLVYTTCLSHSLSISCVISLCVSYLSSLHICIFLYIYLYIRRWLIKSLYKFSTDICCYEYDTSAKRIFSQSSPKISCWSDTWLFIIVLSLAKYL